MQKIIITLPLFTIEVSAEHETELIKKAAFYLSLPKECPKCKQALIFNYRTPQTFEYYELKCIGTPSHSFNLGESKGTHDLYYDPQNPKKQWNEYNPNRTNEPEAAQDRNPLSASSASNANPPSFGGNANIGARKNTLLKLITDCRNTDTNSGLTVGDVGSLGIDDVNAHIERITAILNNRPAAA